MHRAVLGVIGPEDVVAQVERLAQQYTELQVVPLTQRSVAETPEIVRRHQHQLDIILFTSHVHEVLCRGAVEIETPVVSVPISSSSLYQALFRARHHLQEPEVCITVDSILREQVEEALSALGLPQGRALSLDFSPEVSHDQIVEFHLDHWRRGESQALFTLSRAAYPLLVAAGAPAFLIEYPDPLIHQTLQMALLEAKALRHKDSQLMFGFIDVDNFADLVRQFKSEYEIQQFRLRLQSEILNLIQPMSGVLFTEPSLDLSVITTRGVVEEVTRKFTQSVFVERIQSEFGVSVSEGWGAGPVADRARYHAQTALRFAKSAGGGCAYVVLDDTRCIGPLGSPSQTAVPLTNLDPAVLALATSVGVSARTIERLRFLVRKLGRSELTSEEIAQELQMTERNARRIMQKLHETNLVSVEGQDFAHPRGRPRRVYRLQPALVE